MNNKYPQQSYLSRPYKKKSYGNIILVLLSIIMLLFLAAGLIQSLGA